MRCVRRSNNNSTKRIVTKRTGGNSGRSTLRNKKACKGGSGNDIPRHLLRGFENMNKRNNNDRAKEKEDKKDAEEKKEKEKEDLEEYNRAMASIELGEVGIADLRAHLRADNNYGKIFDERLKQPVNMMKNIENIKKIRSMKNSDPYTKRFQDLLGRISNEVDNKKANIFTPDDRITLAYRIYMETKGLDVNDDRISRVVPLPNSQRPSPSKVILNIPDPATPTDYSRVLGDLSNSGRSNSDLSNSGRSNSDLSNSGRSNSGESTIIPPINYSSDDDVDNVDDSELDFYKISYPDQDGPDDRSLRHPTSPPPLIRPHEKKQSRPSSEIESGGPPKNSYMTMHSREKNPPPNIFFPLMKDLNGGKRLNKYAGRSRTRRRCVNGTINRSKKVRKITIRVRKNVTNKRTNKSKSKSKSKSKRKRN